jgi:phenylalanyl-tRNA synthetase beta chain
MEGMADIAEEVARYFGYDNIPTTLLRGETTKGGLTRRQQFNRKVNDACNAAGYSEAKTLSFLSPKAFDKICLAENDVRRQAVVITNPLGEDQSLLRTTALPAMLEAAARNYNYRSPSIHLFEPSKIYLPKLDENGKTDPHQLPEEKSVLVMATYGDDFFHLKGCIEGVLNMLSVPGCVFTPCTDNTSYHPGRCAAIMNGDKLIGYAGQTHPAVLKNYGIGVELYMAELDLEVLFELVDKERYYQPIPKYPASTRDLAVLCDENIYVLQLENCIKKAAKKQLEKLELFDVYRGAQVAQGKKSVAFSLTLRNPDHTLTDKEADEIIQNVLKALESELGATLRA